MADKFYTIEQIAEILGMHHKTIRKFITEGKLKANKVGKQWRISGHDLSLFMENNNVDISKNDDAGKEIIEKITNDSVANTGKITISTVIDIREVDLDEYRKVSNMLLAVMNSRDPKLSNSTINIKYDPKERNLKVMSWGDTEFTKEMMDYISIFTQNN